MMGGAGVAAVFVKAERRRERPRGPVVRLQRRPDPHDASLLCIVLIICAWLHAAGRAAAGLVRGEGGGASTA